MSEQTRDGCAVEASVAVEIDPQKAGTVCVFPSDCNVCVFPCLFVVSVLDFSVFSLRAGAAVAAPMITSMFVNATGCRAHSGDTASMMLPPTSAATTLTLPAPLIAAASASNSASQPSPRRHWGLTVEELSEIGAEDAGVSSTASASTSTAGTAPAAPGLSVLSPMQQRHLATHSNITEDSWSSGPEYVVAANSSTHTMDAEFFADRFLDSSSMDGSETGAGTIGPASHARSHSSEGFFSPSTTGLSTGEKRHNLLAHNPVTPHRHPKSRATGPLTPPQPPLLGGGTMMTSPTGSPFS